jgi:hypothetical protein
LFALARLAARVVRDRRVVVRRERVVVVCRTRTAGVCLVVDLVYLVVLVVNLVVVRRAVVVRGCVITGARLVVEVGRRVVVTTTRRVVVTRRGGWVAEVVRMVLTERDMLWLIVDRGKVTQIRSEMVVGGRISICPKYMQSSKGSATAFSACSSISNNQPARVCKS